MTRKRTINPAVYVTNRDIRNLHLNLNGFPNAGPHPHIGGMRRFWGVHACILIHGAFAYHVSPEVYARVTGKPTTEYPDDIFWSPFQDSSA